MWREVTLGRKIHETPFIGEIYHRVSTRHNLFGECVEFGDYHRRKLQSCSIEILSKMVYRGCARNQQDIRRALEEPSKRNLHWCGLERRRGAVKRRRL